MTVLSARTNCERKNCIRFWTSSRLRGGFHGMRHGAASALLEDGASPALVQKQLRHSDPRITLGIYGHVIGDQQRNAVQNRSARLVN
jgi:integrase